MEQYDIRTITLEQFRHLIAHGDDKHDNQIRVTKSGMVYLSDIVGADQLDNIAFRFETFDANEFISVIQESFGKFNSLTIEFEFPHI